MDFYLLDFITHDTRRSSLTAERRLRRGARAWFSNGILQAANQLHEAQEFAVWLLNDDREGHEFVQARGKQFLTAYPLFPCFAIFISSFYLYYTSVNVETLLACVYLPLWI
jgi:hypothetical protein